MINFSVACCKKNMVFGDSQRVLSMSGAPQSKTGSTPDQKHNILPFLHVFHCFSVSFHCVFLLSFPFFLFPCFLLFIMFLCCPCPSPLSCPFYKCSLKFACRVPWTVQFILIHFVCFFSCFSCFLSVHLIYLLSVSLSLFLTCSYFLSFCCSLSFYFLLSLLF